MPFNLKKLSERRAELMGQLESMVQTCQTETRAFNEEEQANYSKILTEVRSIDATLDAADQAAGLQRVEHRNDGTQTETRSQEEREELETRAFECYIRGVASNVETREEVNMTVGDNGAVIPSSIARKIIKHIYDVCPIYARATRYNVGGNLSIPYHDEKNGTITMAYADEFVELEGQAAKLKSVELKGFLAGALAKISKSLVNNSDFDIVSFVITEVGDSGARWIEGELLNGTEGKVAGLSTVTQFVIAAAPTAITPDELIDLQEKVPDAFQGDAFWIMNRETRTAIRKLKDKDDNYLLNRDLSAKWGYTLLGKDVYTSDNMPKMAGGKTVIHYGDMSGLAVKLSEDMNIEVLREKFATQHAIGVVAWCELDSKVENAQKIASLKMAEG